MSPHQTEVKAVIHLSLASYKLRTYTTVFKYPKFINLFLSILYSRSVCLLFYKLKLFADISLADILPNSQPDPGSLFMDRMT